MQQDTVNSWINLFKRLPINSIQENLEVVGNFDENVQEELYQRLDQPLELETDTATNQQFIKCEFNRDGDSYRSPWSNKYFPEQNDGLLPPQKLRDLEIKAQPLFEEYKKMYYSQGTFSIYISEKEDSTGFIFYFLMKKEIEQEQDIKKGSWDSINIVDVTMNKNENYNQYKCFTTILLNIEFQTAKIGTLGITGSLQKKKVKKTPFNNTDEYHLQKIGQTIEEIETLARKELDSIYIGKTKEIILSTRDLEENEMKKTHDQLRSDFINLQKKN